MRITSKCLQRWLASWIAFVAVWCADYVIYWLSHSPNILEIMEFIAPMLLLLVLCSAYAEANSEGQSMIRVNTYCHLINLIHAFIYKHIFKGYYI